MALDLLLPQGSKELSSAERAFRAVLQASLWDLDNPTVMPGLSPSTPVSLRLTFAARGAATIGTVTIGRGGRWGSFSSSSAIGLAHDVRERLIEIFGPPGE